MRRRATPPPRRGPLRSSPRLYEQRLTATLVASRDDTHHSRVTKEQAPPTTEITTSTLETTTNDAAVVARRPSSTKVIAPILAAAVSIDGRTPFKTPDSNQHSATVDHEPPRDKIKRSNEIKGKSSVPGTSPAVAPTPPTAATSPGATPFKTPVSTQNSSDAADDPKTKRKRTNPRKDKPSAPRRTRVVAPTPTTTASITVGTTFASPLTSNQQSSTTAFENPGRKPSRKQKSKNKSLVPRKRNVEVPTTASAVTITLGTPTPVSKQNSPDAAAEPKTKRKKTNPRKDKPSAPRRTRVVAPTPTTTASIAVGTTFESPLTSNQQSSTTAFENPGRKPSRKQKSKQKSLVPRKRNVGVPTTASAVTFTLGTPFKTPDSNQFAFAMTPSPVADRHWSKQCRKQSLKRDRSGTKVVAATLPAASGGADTPFQTPNPNATYNATTVTPSPNVLRERNDKGESMADALTAPSLEPIVSGGGSKKCRKYNRTDNSLSVLAQRFYSMLENAPGHTIDLNDASHQLGVQKRRIYDATNVLEGIGILKKEEKNFVTLVCNLDEAEYKEERQELKLLGEEEAQLDEWLQELENHQHCQEMYLSGQDLLHASASEDTTFLTICTPDGTTTKTQPHKEGDGKHTLTLRPAKHRKRIQTFLYEGAATNHRLQPISLTTQPGSKQHDKKKQILDVLESGVEDSSTVQFAPLRQVSMAENMPPPPLMETRSSFGLFSLYCAPEDSAFKQSPQHQPSPKRQVTTDPSTLVFHNNTRSPTHSTPDKLLQPPLLLQVSSAEWTRGKQESSPSNFRQPLPLPLLAQRSSWSATALPPLFAACSSEFTFHALNRVGTQKDATTKDEGWMKLDEDDDSPEQVHRVPHLYVPRHVSL